MKFVIFFLLAVSAVSAFKLNLPRVLLPLFKFSTNFTLKDTDNGCYKWTLSRLDIIQVIPINWNKQLDCSSEVVLSTITKEFNKNTVIVLAEEVTTKEVLRCDVIVDVIASLDIVTKTRQLFVEESPEIFEVRAQDKQGNEFSTLEGIEFLWTITSGKSTDVSGENDVIRFINFKDTPYEIPKTVYALDSRGLKGHIVLLEGVKPGTANVSVELKHVEYKQVPPATVQLNVIANLIIEPSCTYILPGDVVHYKLLQVKNGRFVEVPLPSTQYSLNIEDSTVAYQFRPWVVEATALGQTKLVLSDVNSKMSNVDDATYLPSVTLHIVSPVYMNLLLLPHKNWITALYQPNAIVTELYDSSKHKISIGPHAIIKMEIDPKFQASQKTRNGSYVDGYAREIGVIHVKAEFASVRTNNNVLIPFDLVTAQADITVYPGLTISPGEIIIPWDPVESSEFKYQLNVTGGDGLYQYSIANHQIALVTQLGVMKPRGIGRTEITCAMQKNPAIHVSAKVVVQPPTLLKIVYNSVESEVGSPVYLGVALYYKAETRRGSKNVLFTDCTNFPFQISIANADFHYNISSRITTPSDACTTIGIVGDLPGTALVSVSYVSDGLLLKDVAKVSTYQPLKILSPESGKTVLSVGAQRYLVFVGGPATTGDEHDLVVDFDKLLVSVDRIPGNTDTERVYLVTCQAVGDSWVTVKVVNRYVLEEFESAPTSNSVEVVCAHPKSVWLATEKADDSRSCPAALASQNMVLNDRAVVLRVTITDERGNVFDNATSLGVRWSLSNADLAKVRFTGIVKLQDEDHQRYQLPLHHYQVIEPAQRDGTLDVTAKIFDYRKSWLKKLSIDLEDKVFKAGSGLHATITLTLVHNLHLSAEQVSVFNHPLNVARVYVTHGSGVYVISSTAAEAARVDFVEASKSIDIVPVLPGAFMLTVRDACLRSEPVTVRVRVLTVTEIQVEVISKIEKGRQTRAFLRLFDSEGNVVTKQELSNLRAEVDDSNIVDVDCDNIGRTDERIVCSISGRELGHANLVFRAGMENSAVRSAPVRIQVYPPLQLVPRNITLIPGAVVQLTAKGGPQPDCLIEYAVENEVIAVDHGGNVVGSKLGEGFVTGRAVGVTSDGEKVVYSVDTVRVNVVHLEGVRLKTPLMRVRSGAAMPVWVEGVPEQINPLILASVEPSLAFKWDVSSANLTRISHIFEDVGIKVSDSEKISMRIHAIRSGRLIVTVKVTAPPSVLATGHRGRFTDSVSIDIFDDLEVINHAHRPVLMAPNMKYQARTNKDKVAHVTYQRLKIDAASSKVLDVDEKGLISTHDRYGFSYIQVDSVEDDVSRSTRFAVQVAGVQYIMLNVVPELQVKPGSSVFGLPKGVKLQFFVTYHDTEGSVFTATNNNLKYQLNKIDRIRVSQNENNNNLLLDLLDSGITAMKLFDDDASVSPDYVKINAVSYVQPDKMNFTVGDVVCFQAPAIVENTHVCSWYSSNENSLSIDRKTGFAVAKSKQNHILVSFQCSNNLQMVTTADVYALQKVEILASGVSSISNNGKRFIVPLVLLNEIDGIGAKRANDLAEKSCISDTSEFHYPYECDIKWDGGSSNVDINSIFKVYPTYDDKHGHACAIQSENVGLPIQIKAETDVVLMVSWNRYHSSKIPLSFKPAISVQNTKLTITDQEPVDVIQVVGVPSVLGGVQVIPSNNKYIGITQDEADTKSMLRYSVYLKTAYLKKSSCSEQGLSVWIVSEASAQNISIPLYIEVNADQYVTPHYFTEQVTYYANEYLFKAVVAFVIGLIIYLSGLKMYNKINCKGADDHSFFDASHNRGHFSDRSISPSYSHQRSALNEIQMIYGRTPERTLRSRRN